MFPDRTDDKFEQPGVAVIHPEINLPVSGFFPPVSDNLFSAAAVRSQVRLLEGTGPIVQSKVHRVPFLYEPIWTGLNSAEPKANICTIEGR